MAQVKGSPASAETRDLVAKALDDAAEARRFYGEKLSLPLKPEADSDYTVVELPGLKHFGLSALG